MAGYRNGSTEKKSKELKMLLWIPGMKLYGFTQQSKTIKIRNLSMENVKKFWIKQVSKQ